MALKTKFRRKSKLCKQILVAFLIAALILAGTSNKIFSIGAFVLCCCVLVKEKDFGIQLLFFIMPMAGIFKIRAGGTSLFTYIEILYVLYAFVSQKLAITKVDVGIIILAQAMMAAELISGTVAIQSTIKVLINLLLLEIFMQKLRTQNIRQLYLWFIAGVLTSSFMGLCDSSIFPINRYVTAGYAEVNGYGSVINRFTGLTSDPNFYTVNVIVALCLVVVLYKQDVLTVLQAGSIIGVFSVFAGMTGSKSALLMLGIVMIFFLIACFQKKQYGVVLIFGIVAVLGVAALFSGRIEAFSGTLERLEHSTHSLDNLTTGRISIWEAYFEYFGMHPWITIIGNGVGIDLLLGYGWAAHNTYIDCIYQLGIIGTVIYCLVLASIMKKEKKPFKRNALNYSVIFCVLMMFFFLSQLQGYELPFQIALCILVWNDSRLQKSRVKYIGKA